MSKSPLTYVVNKNYRNPAVAGFRGFEKNASSENITSNCLDLQTTYIGITMNTA